MEYHTKITAHSLSLYSYCKVSEIFSFYSIRLKNPLNRKLKFLLVNRSVKMLIRKTITHQ